MTKFPGFEQENHYDGNSCKCSGAELTVISKLPNFAFVLELTFENF